MACANLQAAIAAVHHGLCSFIGAQLQQLLWLYWYRRSNTSSWVVPAAARSCPFWYLFLCQKFCLFLKETVVTANECMQARAMQQYAVYLRALCSLHALIAQLGRQHVSLANASYVRQTSVVSWNPVWS